MCIFYVYIYQDNKIVCMRNKYLYTYFKIKHKYLKNQLHVFFHKYYYIRIYCTL